MLPPCPQSPRILTIKRSIGYDSPDQTHLGTSFCDGFCGHSGNLLLNISKQTLTTGWRVREVAQEGMPAHNQLPWLPAQVPGSVHLDLLRAGVIPNPFERMHERDVAWVDESDWVYETEFTVDGPPPSYAFLLFHGLDTMAEITLNGQALGTTETMFIPHEFPVGGRLQTGTNTLRVTFRSVRRVGQERMAAWNSGGNDTLPGHWDNWDERAFVRKAQYQYGWDWGPVLRGCGIWQPVELITVPVARLGDGKHSVVFNPEGNATVTVTTEVERLPGQEDTPLTLTVRLQNAEALSLAVPTGTGRVEVSGSVILARPRRWQPSGYGEAALYDLTLTLSGAGGEADGRVSKIGLRTIELVREADADGKGEGFKFRVNGVDVYAKGANWIPDHSFPSLITSASLRERVTQARDAHFTMLRIWGGGFYESEEFYALCDEMGLLVWQDFPYGCSYYPDTGDYAQVARVEATAAVKRVRNHVSLALWCGNNENHTMFESNWTGTRPPRLLGEHLYHEVLPAVVAAEDPQTPYWPGSPYGGPVGDSNSADFGDCHNWDVWHGRGDWVNYTENDSRFCSEFGFASSCGLGAWDTCLALEDRHPHSPVVRWHDKTRKGYETYLGLIDLHFPVAQTLEDLVYYSQCNQAEALKYGVEHYRRRKGRNWGTLFWQLNDCWPVQSWAVIDSTGIPKAAYFACKKFYAPVLLSLVRDGESVEAHLVNDGLTPLAGEIKFTVVTLNGETLSEETAQTGIDANAASLAATFSLTEALGRETDVYAYARFTAADGTIAENFLLGCEPKELATAAPGLTLTVTEGGTHLALTVTAQKFAPYVWIRRTDNGPLPGLADNFFHVQPGETKTLTITKAAGLETADALRGLLTVRTL
jgi:beta-mannosidase